MADRTTAAPAGGQRPLAEGLEDIRKGRTHGPYATAEAAIKALDARAKRPAKKKSRR